MKWHFHDIDIEPFGFIEAICVWGETLVVANLTYFIHLIEKNKLCSVIKTKKILGRQVPTALCTWKDMLCIGFNANTVVVYSKERTLFTRITVEHCVNEIASIGEYLYITSGFTITRCNLKGECTLIFHPETQSLNLRPLASVVIFRGWVLKRDGEELHVLGECKDAPKETLVLGDIFRWSGRLWALSYSRNEIISWNLHEKFPPELYPKLGDGVSHTKGNECITPPEEVTHSEHTEMCIVT